MGLYLMVATRDLRAVVSTTCTAFYMPFDRLAIVSYRGSAEELARRLDLDRTGGSWPRIGALQATRVTAVAAVLMVALLSLSMLT